MKAIETNYKGYRFRSRLEARWAVFMDALNVKWTYEPEGFDLGETGWYLPDFYLPKLDCYLEIKPYTWGAWPDGTTWEKAEAFYHSVGKWIVILCGEPGPVVPWNPNARSYEAFVMGDRNYYWCECSHCGAIGIQFEGRASRNKHQATCPSVAQNDDKQYGLDSPRIGRAYLLARGARFEHNKKRTRFS